MSTIAPDQLPTPSCPAPAVAPLVWGGAPVAPTTAVRASAAARRRKLTLVAAAAVVVTLGGVGVAMNRGTEVPAGSSDDRRSNRSETNEVGADPEATSATDPAATDPGTAGNVNGDIDFAGAYRALFGVAPAAATLECVTDAGAGLTTEIEALITGANQTYESVQAGFVPFAQCAPDQDFVGAMLPAAQQVLGGAGDQNCIAGLLSQFDVAGRSEVLAVAYVDINTFVERMYSTFSGCIV